MPNIRPSPQPSPRGRGSRKDSRPRDQGENLTESLVNSIGYDLLGRDRTEAALAVFRWNVETYPESWNVYDSFAEALAKSGDGNAAIFNYERSLELNPEDSNAVARLAKLREHQPG